MKTFRSLFLVSGLLALLTPGFLQSQEPIDCRMVGARIEEAVKAAPDHTLTIVEDALVAAPNCVCEIVKAAITASGADAGLVKKIVYTAVKTTQQHAPIIAECAVAAAPNHADAVRAAFAEAFEDAPRTSKRNQPKKPAQVAAAKPEPQPAPVIKPAPQPQRPAVPQPQPAPVVYQAPETLVAEMASGKQVVEFGPAYAYDPKGVVEDSAIVEPPEDADFPPQITFLGGPPIDLSGLYLVPPVASSRPFPEMDEKEDPHREVGSLSTTRKVPPRRVPKKPKPPRPPVISKPMSPTGP